MSRGMGVFGVWVIVLLLFPTKAQAYWGTYDVGNLAGLDFQYRMNTIVMNNAMRAGTSGARAAATSTAHSAALPTAARDARRAAAELAQSYPAAHRAQTAEVFESLLGKYAQIEKRFGIAPGDFGGAVAAYVAGNMMALRQEPFPDEHFSALVKQMRGVITDSPEFTRIDVRERRRAYEQMAIIGMFMAGTQMALAQKPDSVLQARTAAAARQYLAKVIPGDIDRLVVTPAGLQMR